MNELMAVIHAVIVAVLGVLVLMLRRVSLTDKKKAVNGASDLYRRIEDAERRIMERLDSLTVLKERRR